MKPLEVFCIIPSYIDEGCLLSYNIPLLIAYHLLSIQPGHYLGHNIAHSNSYHYRSYRLIIIKQPPIFIQTLGSVPFLPSDLKSLTIVPLGLAVDKCQGTFDSYKRPVHFFAVDAVS